MSEIYRYVVVDDRDNADDCEHISFAEAVDAANARNEPAAVVRRVYTFDDSELVWTTTGDTIWPPPPTPTEDVTSG